MSKILLHFNINWSLPPTVHKIKNYDMPYPISSTPSKLLPHLLLKISMSATQRVNAVDCRSSAFFILVFGSLTHYIHDLNGCNCTTTLGVYISSLKLSMKASDLVYHSGSAVINTANNHEEQFNNSVGIWFRFSKRNLGYHTISHPLYRSCTEVNFCINIVHLMLFQL